jgi:peptidoglycan-associated lipoprotein
MATRRAAAAAAWLALVLTAAAGCNRNPPPVARPAPPPPGASTAASRPPAPPEPVAEPTIVPPEPVNEDRVTSATIDDLNRNSPLKPAFFDYDSAEITPPARSALDDNAAILKKNNSSAEYNLALGERRAMAARTYLVSLGIPADRLRVVSYGKEFPFDPGHDETAYAKNRRAHFVITAQ